MKRLLMLLSVVMVLNAHGQSDRLTLPQAIEIALRQNAGIRAAGFEVSGQNQLRKTSFDLPKTNVSLMYGQYNSYRQDNNFTVTQAIPFTAFGSQGALNRSLIAASELKKAVSENELVYQVKQTYFQLLFLKARSALLLQQDSIYEGFLKSATGRYKTGETFLLEQTTAESQRNDVRNQLTQNRALQVIYQTQLKTLLNATNTPEISEEQLHPISIEVPQDSATLSANPSLAYVRQQVEVAKSQRKFENAKFAPDFVIGYFNQTLIDLINVENGAVAKLGDRFTGFQIGLGIPLWFRPHEGRAKAASFNQKAAESQYQNYQITLQGQFQQAFLQYSRNSSSLDYYQSSALPNANLILKQSQGAFRQGEIGYAEYLLGVRNAIALKEGYLQTLNDYNQSIIYLEYLSGIK